jgi:ATP-dependent helicase HrpB|tara:strand:- start:39866 stop:40753 length:888 start_codon:yes stop_codon:yes gene_type:complete
MANILTPLPIDALSPDVEGLWNTGQNVVLSAPTGSGKSTRIPQMLAQLAGSEKTILVLQPRRVAEEWQTPLGKDGGYHIRHDKKMTAATRIVFLTEGILLRRLQHDPQLIGVAAVIFDEFHERHLAGDVGLAMVRRLQKEDRADLRLFVMSATLSPEGLQDYLAPAQTLRSDGRTFPVEIAYTRASEVDSRAPVWKNVASAFRREARNGFEGDCLIFMPGAFEIRKTIEALEALPDARPYEILRLHGEQASEEQDRAFRASNRPKVIVATNIAETSLTLPEVRLVIDRSGPDRRL